MKITLEKISTSPKAFMRACGYVEIANPHKDNEISYARGLDSGRFYPRFHVYLSHLPDNLLEINLHLDMKKPSYGGETAHSGEYDGELIENEAARIENAAKEFTPAPPVPQQLGFKKEKSFWRKILGL